MDPIVDVDFGEISLAPYQDSKSGSLSLWPGDYTDYKNNESRIVKHFNFRTDILAQRNGGLIPAGDKGVSSYTQRPDRLWRSSRLPPNGYRGLRGWGKKTDLQLVLRVGSRRAVPSFAHTFLLCDVREEIQL